jgi:hypothetical protein
MTCVKRNQAGGERIHFKNVTSNNNLPRIQQKKGRMLVALILFILVSLNRTYSVAQQIPLTASTLDPIHTKLEEVKFKGKKAVRITGLENGEQVTLVKNVDFKNGVFEIDVAGQPLPGSDPNSRGFIGMAFRIQQADSLAYNCFYLRPTNGRAEDQLRRNHSVQYISHPHFPWHKLRKDNPGMYESYVDIVPGEWTKIKVVVKEKEARLFVNNSNQPCLIVKDLKGGPAQGSIGLWIGPETDGYFKNLTLTKD